MAEKRKADVVYCDECCYWNKIEVELEDEKKGTYRCLCNEIDMMTLPTDYCSFAKPKPQNKKGGIKVE
jgi:hypothetical protein